MPKVLVTGGAGFIGSHIVARFAGAGTSVTVLDDLSTGRSEHVPPGVRLHVLDVGSDAAAELIAEGSFDVIVHLAAQMDVRKSVADPRHDATVNVLGTLNVLEAVRRSQHASPPRVVFASTGGALYGETPLLPTPETAPAQPDAPYGIAKLSAEHYLGYYSRVWGIPTIALRLGNVYGPRQNPHGEAGVVAIFGQRMVSGEPVTVYGAGTQTRDYTFVADVADAFHAAAHSPLPANVRLGGRAYNVGTGVGTSVLSLAKLIGDAAGTAPNIIHAPSRPGEIERSQLDARKAGQDLGWKPRVPLTEGLARTVGWIRETRTAGA